MQFSFLSHFCLTLIQRLSSLTAKNITRCCSLLYLALEDSYGNEYITKRIEENKSICPSWTMQYKRYLPCPLSQVYTTCCTCKYRKLYRRTCGQPENPRTPLDNDRRSQFFCSEHRWKWLSSLLAGREWSQSSNLSLTQLNDLKSLEIIILIFCHFNKNLEKLWTFSKLAGILCTTTENLDIILNKYNI